MDRAKREVLRYLGRRGQEVPPGIDALVDECMAEMRRIARPRQTWRRFALERTGAGLLVAGTALTLPGQSIAQHMEGCGEAALMAVTLGARADAEIRRWERADLTRSIVLDACAAQLVEEVCDGAEADIRADAAASGLRTTGRFSPGYGDLLLDIQPALLAVLDAGRRCGLTCTDSLILLPRKSVTALMGIGRAPARAKRGCASCPLRESCPYRKDGEPDGCPELAQ